MKYNRTATHQKLVTWTIDVKRNLQAEDRQLREQIEYLSQQRHEIALDLQRLPYDEDIEDFTHQQLADAMETAGVEPVPDELLLDDYDVEPLLFYRWQPGVSRRIGAIVRNGCTLTGPVSL